MLLKKFTDEERKIAHILFDPMKMAGVLFKREINQFEDFQYFPESNQDKFQLRPYQIPFMSQEYSLVKKPDESARAFFERKIRLGTSYCFSGRGIGKCEWVENKILSSDGVYHRLGDLIGQTLPVYSLDESTNQFVEALAFVYDNGQQECFKLTLSSGKNITVTSNHPFLSANGWKVIADLHPDEYIAVPNRIPYKHNKRVNENTAKLLGYLLGDGSTAHGQIGFTNINGDVIKEIYQIADWFGCEVRKQGVSYFFRSKNKSQANPIKRLVKKYGIDTLSKNKKIPTEVFTWRRKYVALLLNRLFTCDGHVNKKLCNIEITLASRQMIEDIQSLLLKFGIHSNYTYKDSVCGNKHFDAWRLTICRDFEKFIINIGVFTKDNGIDFRGYKTGEIIPTAVFESTYNNLKERHPGIIHNVRFDKNKLHGWDVSSYKIKELFELTEDFELLKFIYSKISWEKIVSIEPVGILPTVTVQVPKYRNYISNNVLSHNSLISLLIDMLFDSIYNYKGWLALFISRDDGKVKKVYDAYLKIMKHHPFFKMFNPYERRADLTVECGENGGHKLVAGSMALTGSEPGGFVESHHADKIYMDESQSVTDGIMTKLTHATNKTRGGAIKRFAGITEFSKHSPIGRILTDPHEREKVIQLPQYVSEDWTEEAKQEAIRDHNGKEDPGYKVHVEAKIIENTEGLYDMERIRLCYRLAYEKKRLIKHFEISKDNFFRLEDILILDKPKNCSRVWVAEDYGERIAEIIILFEFDTPKGPIFKYEYNITLYDLSAPEEHEAVHDCINKQINPNFHIFDATEAGGSEVARRLQKKRNPASVIPIRLNTSIETEPERDEQGEVIRDKDNKIKFVKKAASEWAVHCIKKLFYNLRIEALYDVKLDKQFDSMRGVKTPSGNTRIFCGGAEDHEHACWQVFALGHFLNENNYIENDEDEEDEFFGFI